MGNVQDSQDPFLHLSTYFTSKILKKNPNIHETVPVLMEDMKGGVAKKFCFSAAAYQSHNITIDLFHLKQATVISIETVHREIF